MIKTRGLMSELLSQITDVCQRDLASTCVLCLLNIYVPNLTREQKLGMVGGGQSLVRGVT